MAGLFPHNEHFLDEERQKEQWRAAEGLIRTLQSSSGGGGAPSGPAGGDLAGSTYPNPIIAAGVVTGAKIAVGAVTDSNVNAGAAIDATKIGAGGVTSTEFGYIGSLTSDAQTQLNAKAALTTPLNGMTVNSPLLLTGGGTTLAANIQESDVANLTTDLADKVSKSSSSAQSLAGLLQFPAGSAATTSIRFGSTAGTGFYGTTTTLLAAVSGALKFTIGSSIIAAVKMVIQQGLQLNVNTINSGTYPATIASTTAPQVFASGSGGQGITLPPATAGVWLTIHSDSSVTSSAPLTVAIDPTDLGNGVSYAGDFQGTIDKPYATVVLTAINDPILGFLTWTAVADFAHTGTALDFSVTLPATPLGNVTTTETTLYSKTIPTSYPTGSESFVMDTFGTFAATANNKRVRAKYDGSVIFDTGSLAITSASTWHLTVRMWRDGGGTVHVASDFSCSDTTVPPKISTATATATSNLLSLTGQGTSTNDITCNWAEVNYNKTFT